MSNNVTEEMVERESMEVDVVIVGGGPSGLSAAIRLMQLAEKNDDEFIVVVVEKASEIGKTKEICEIEVEKNHNKKAVYSLQGK